MWPIVVIIIWSYTCEEFNDQTFVGTACFQGIRTSFCSFIRGNWQQA
jgi:hypothetical protein